MLIVRINQYTVYLAILLGSLLPFSAHGKSDERMATDAMTDYFDLIRSGNYESALGMWEPSTIERATRLGIEYNNIPVKPDCNSPVLNNWDQVKDKLDIARKTKVTLETGMFKFQFNADTTSGSINYKYYTKKLGKYFWFIFPQDYYAADWPVYESKYFKFYVNPKRDNSYNKIASAELDAFVDKIAAKISLAPKQLDILAKEKIYYYLCSNEPEVRMISGRQTDGLYDPASDAIISSVFPEFHLVAQLLVNYKLQNLPLFTLPVIKEGLATSLGGKWQRSAGVILDFGEYILDYKLTEIDSVLTAIENENNEMSDITFPIEACLINYIYDELGTNKFFKLYKALSGDIHFVNGLSIEKVKTIIAESFKQPWPEFKKQFEDFIASNESFSGQIQPGRTETDQVLLKNGGLVISSSDKWLEISFSVEDDQNPETNLLFSKPASLIGKTSELFKEQYKDRRKYKGYRFGIRIDMNEIGLYDYAINRLKAKYVYNFAPDPSDFDSTGHKIAAHFDIRLLDGILPGDSDYEILR